MEKVFVSRQKNHLLFVEPHLRVGQSRSQTENEIALLTLCK
jgi:hypothetical protein